MVSWKEHEECPIAAGGVDPVSDTEFLLNAREEDRAAGELDHALGAVEATPKEDDDILSKKV